MQMHEGDVSASADPARGRTPASQVLYSVAGAWVLSLGFDLFLHAGLLASLYTKPSPFLLGPDDAFQRIPLGYLAFLVLTLSLYWLLRQLRVRGASAGLRLGLATGAILWGAFCAGLYSISTVGLPLAASWWVGQTIELGLAGAVLGAAADGVPMRRIWITVTITVVVFVAATVVLQSIGWAPPMKTA